MIPISLQIDNIPLPLRTISWIEAIAKKSLRGHSRNISVFINRKRVAIPSSIHRRILVFIILLIIPILYMGISTTWNWSGETLQLRDLRRYDILAVYGDFIQDDGRQLLANLIIRLPPRQPNNP